MFNKSNATNNQIQTSKIKHLTNSNQNECKK